MSSAAEQKPPYAALAVSGYGAVLGSFFPLVAVYSVADISGGLHVAADSAALVNTFQNVGAICGILATPALAFGVGRGRAMAVMGAGFVISSALCAMAPNLPVMLFARTLHGVFGGAMPLMFMLLVMTTLMPGSGRFEGMTLFATSTTLFFGLAATVGGALVEVAGWRSLFWAQAMLALPYWFLGRRVMTQEKGRIEVLKVADWPHFTLLSFGLALIVIAASEGERHFWLEAWWVPALLLGGGVMAGFAVVGMLRTEKPLLLLSAFRRATFTWGIVLSVFFRFGQMFAVYIVPSYLGRLQGYRPIDTGAVLFAMMPSTAIALAISYLWGRRLDSRWLLSAGLASFAAAAALCIQLTPDWAADQLRVGAAVAGFGMGFFSVAVLRFATYQVTMQDGPTVGMIFNLTRVFGIVSGLGILSHLVVEREKFHSAILVEAIGATSPETAQRLAQTTGAFARFGGDADGAQAAAVTALARASGVQAFTLAFSDAFFVSAIALGLGAILVWALPAVPAEEPAASKKIETKRTTA
ncbi:MFS transporter [Sphingomonas sp. ASY06-1R]|uniref:MFS transporter n=1 Tax=Sphingomonas sp. ASY06-1R TaxID=3445771 RepID=UPI003FA2AE60